MLALPGEVILLVCEYLRPQEILQLSHTNRYLYELLDDEALWRRWCQNTLHCQAHDLPSSPRYHYFSVRAMIQHHNPTQEPLDKAWMQRNSFDVFERALQQCDVRTAQCLVDHGFSLRRINDEGCTLLHIFIQQEHFPYKRQVVQWLLNGGVDVNMSDFVKFTPLHYAVLYGDDQEDLVELLLTRGAKLRSRDFQKQTPFDLAVSMDKTLSLQDILRPTETLSESDSDWER